MTLDWASLNTSMMRPQGRGAEATACHSTWNAKIYQANNKIRFGPCVLQWECLQLRDPR